MSFRGVLFDLDGTLADTLADLAACGNQVREAYGRPPLPTERYRRLVGQGVRHLVRALLDLSEDDPRLPGIVEEFRALQLAHGLDRTRPYPGIPELLRELSRRGLRLAVLSNKPHAATAAMVSALFGDRTFAAVRGQREGAPLKPDPTEALAIAAELGTPPADWLLLGDSGVDMRTARAAGMRAIGALWGFRDAAELREAGAHALIAVPGDLLDEIG